MLKFRVIALILFLGLCRTGTTAPFQEVLPPETLAVVSITNMSDLIEKAKKVPIYSLIQDPEMKPFLDHLKEQIVKETGMSEDVSASLNDPWKLLAQGLKDVLEPASIDEFINAVKAPKGQVIIALTNVNPEDNSVGVAALCDVGDQNPVIKKSVLEMLSKNTDPDLTVATTTFLGAEVVEIKSASPDSPLKTIRIAFPENVFYIGNDEESLNCLLAAKSGESRPGLALEPAYQLVKSKVDPSPDVEVYINVPRIVKLAQRAAIKNSPEAAGIFRALGLNLLGPMTVSVVIEDTGRIHQKIFLSMPGELKGIAKILAQKNASHEPPALVPAEADTYLSLSLDWSALYQEIESIARETDPVQYESFQMAMQENFRMVFGNEGLNLKTDLFDKMGKDVKYYTYIDDSGTEKAQEIVVTASLKDPAAFENVLTKLSSMLGVYATFEKRDYQGSPIYDLSAMGQKQGGGYTIAGNQIGIGKSESLEKMIRDQSGSSPGLAGNEAFQRLTSVFPKESIMLGFSNDSKSIEFVIETVTRMLEAQSFDEGTVTEAPPLPDKKTIAKYFGYTVQYAEWKGDGIFADSTSFAK